MRKVICLLVFALGACAQIPEGVVAVRGFDVNRFVGTWYEIARLDHSFERGLINVTADYRLLEDGSLEVVNRGFDPELNRWKEAKGRAYFLCEAEYGRLEVTFFWPFYGGYNILEIDESGYAHALICGNTRSYLWILARQPELPKTVLASLIERAKELDFNTDALIFVQKDNKVNKQGAGDRE